MEGKKGAFFQAYLERFCKDINGKMKYDEDDGILHGIQVSKKSKNNYIKYIKNGHGIKNQLLKNIIIE